MLVQNLSIIILQDIQIHTDHLPGQETLHFLDLVHTPIHMYHPAAVANAVTPTNWFYTL